MPESRIHWNRHQEFKQVDFHGKGEQCRELALEHPVATGSVTKEPEEENRSKIGPRCSFRRC
jgi:hypothetical protein